MQPMQTRQLQEGGAEAPGVAARGDHRPMSDRMRAMASLYAACDGAAVLSPDAMGTALRGKVLSRFRPCSACIEFIQAMHEVHGAVEATGRLWKKVDGSVEVRWHPIDQCSIEMYNRKRSKKYLNEV